MSFVTKQRENGSLVLLVIALAMLACAAVPLAHGLTITATSTGAAKVANLDSRLGDSLTWIQAGETGFGDANNVEVKSMAVFSGHLYTGNKNSVTGTEIWRTADGVSWEQANIDGFGDANNMNLFALVPFNDDLYAATDNSTLGGGTGCELWRTDDGTEWSQVGIDGFGDANNLVAWTMAVFSDTLYVGTLNHANGAEVWRSPDGSGWEQVNEDGFGDANNLRALSMSVFDGHLYVGTKNSATGTEIRKTQNGIAWDQVNIDGFGSTANNGTYAMASFGGYLYAGTQNMSTGAQLWRTPDGTTWELVTADGFGDTDNDTINILAILGDDLYAGTARAAGATTGAQLYRTSEGTSWSQVNTDGFGVASNEQINCLAAFRSHYYAGVRNETLGGQVWRTVIASVYLPFVTRSYSPEPPYYYESPSLTANCSWTGVWGYVRTADGLPEANVQMRVGNWQGWRADTWTDADGIYGYLFADHPIAGDWFVQVYKDGQPSSRQMWWETTANCTGAGTRQEFRLDWRHR